MAVFASLVVGSDGSTTKGGNSRGITSGVDRTAFLSRRRSADFLLIGGETARAEPYQIRQAMHNTKNDNDVDACRSRSAKQTNKQTRGGSIFFFVFFCSSSFCCCARFPLQQRAQSHRVCSCSRHFSRGGKTPCWRAQHKVG